MSAQHTPGTMSLQSIISITSSHNLVVDGRVIARVAKTDGRQDYSLPGEANARRLAACWNACEGIETYALELMTGDLSIKQQITATGSAKPPKPTSKAVEYRRQRDELLAALEVAEESVGDINALEIVRAAISKVKSKTT